jgi:hypothetical protein
MTYDELERLKVEADRWIAAVTSNGAMSGAASRGIRELMDKVHIQSSLRPEGGASIDEKRYQFLRMNPDGAYFFPQCLPDGTWTMRLVGDTALDAAIDEAMAKQSPMNKDER